MTRRVVSTRHESEQDATRWDMRSVPAPTPKGGRRRGTGVRGLWAHGPAVLRLSLSGFACGSRYRPFLDRRRVLGCPYSARRVAMLAN